MDQGPDDLYQAAKIKADKEANERFTAEDRIAFFYGARKAGKRYYAMDHARPDYRQDLAQLTNNVEPGTITPDELRTALENRFDDTPDDVWHRRYSEHAERRYPSRSPVAKAKAKERNRKAAKAARKARRK